MARPALRLRLAPKFPSRVIGTTGIDVTQTGGAYTFAMDWSEFQENVGTLDPGRYEILGYDEVESEFIRLPLSTTRTPFYREVTTAGAVTVTTSDGVIGINKTVPEITTVNLLPAEDGFPLTIKDIAGNAGSFNITIDASGSETIDGAATFVMSSDFQSLVLTPVPGGWVTSAEYSGDTPVSPGTYSFATVTVDKRGRLTFAQSGTVPTVPAGVLSNAGLAASVAANALTISLTDATGATPSSSSFVSIPFRSATAATGAITQRSVTTATTLVISSGSTVGFANTTAGRLWIVVFDDAGTFRLGAINCRSGVNIFPLGQMGIASSTAEGGGGAADSAHVFYTGAAVTSKPYTVLGYLEWSAGLTTAGTWAIVPTQIETIRTGVKLPGDVQQRVSDRYTTNAALSTVLPFDNTVPTSSEGTQVLSVSITPAAAANLISANYKGQISTNGAAYVGSAMFSGGAAAVAADLVICNTANDVAKGTIDYWQIAGGTSSQSWSVRVGPASGGFNAYMNGTSAGQFYGGSSAATLIVEEIVA